MSEPSIDHGLMSKALEWAWTVVLGLVGVVYSLNNKKHETAAETLRKIDEKVDHEVRCARIEIKGKADNADLKEAIANMRDTSSKLFANAEQDRKETREHLTEIDRRAQDTIRTTTTDIMTAIAQIQANCLNELRGRK